MFGETETQQIPEEQDKLEEPIEEDILPSPEPVSPLKAVQGVTTERPNAATAASNPEEQETQAPIEDDLVDPALVDLVGADLIGLPYDEASTKLKDLYKTTKWADREEAAQKVSLVASDLKKKNHIGTSVDLTTDAVDVSRKIMDRLLTEDQKIEAIETWRETAKQNLFNTDNPDDLVDGEAKEELIDSYATQLRRGVLAGDTGWAVDMMYRGVEATLTSIAGMTDAVAGTKLQPALRETIADRTNPELDESITAKVGSAVGILVGFAAASVNPISAYAYLGATLVDQSKAIYDQALEATQSEDAAKEALYKSAPWIVLGTFSHKFVGGTIGALIRGKPGYAGALTGLVSGAGGAVAQVAGTGEALVSATGDEKFRPTGENILKEAAVFGAIGGVAGAISGIKQPPKVDTPTLMERRIVEANKTILDAEQVIERSRVVRDQVAEAVTGRKPTVHAEEESVGPAQNDADAFYDDFVVKPDETKVADPYGKDAADRALEKEQQEPNGYAVDADEMVFPPEQKTTAEVLAEDPPTIIKEDSIPRGALADRSPPEAMGEARGKGEAPKVEGVPPPPLTAPKPTGFPSSYLKVFTPNTDFIPSPALAKLVNAAGSYVRAANLEKRDGQITFGFYDPNTHSIAINKRVFLDQEHAKRTFAHEVGHMIDLLKVFRAREQGGVVKSRTGDITLEPVIDKLIQFDTVLRSRFSEEKVALQTEEISRQWRKGWDGTIVRPDDKSWNGYRSQTVEIQADTISAIFGDPKWVKENFPETWNAFIAGLDTHPELKQFYAEFQDAGRNPEKLNTWLVSEMEASRAKEVQILRDDVIARSEALVTERKEAAVQAGNAFSRKLVNKFNEVRRYIDKMDGVEREEAIAQENKLYASLASAQNIRAELDAPVINLLDRFAKSGLAKGDIKAATTHLQNYLYWDRIINETTESMSNMESNPGRYVRAFEFMKEEMLARNEKARKEGKRPPVTDLQLKTVMGVNLEGTGRDLINSFAAMQGNTSLQNLANLSRYANTYGHVIAAEVFDKASFNVRRFMANPQTDELTARRGIALMEQQLGGKESKDFKDLQGYVQEFHDIIGNAMYGKLKDSGRATPEMLKRIELNKNNWVTYNVLKYFEEDPVFKATIKSGKGTFEGIGNVLPDTVSKTRAIIQAADHQISQNAAVGLAAKIGHGMREIDDAYVDNSSKLLAKKLRGQSVYDQRDILKKENPDKSYLIEYEKGKPTLYEIDSPSYAKMFEKSEIMNNPLLSWVLNHFENFAKIVGARELKTAFSPVFFLAQKFNDRGVEAILARSWEIPGLPVHTSAKLRALDKAATAKAKNFRSGLLDDVTREMVDQNSLPYHISSEFGGFDDPKLKPENAFYEMAGTPIEGEQKLSFPDKANRILNKSLEFIGFGKIRNWVEQDEVKAKIMAYTIAREIRGFSKPEAARIAREWAGTPDPLGGGSEVSGINKLALFGRANINGLRSVANQFKDDPKGYGLQYMYRRVMPRLLVSAPVMAPLVAALFGEEEGKLTRKFLEKVSSFDKLSKQVIPLGFVNEAGELVGWNVKSQDINANWKAAYLRLPVAREVMSIDQLMYAPFKAMEDLLDTGTISAKNILQNISKSLGATVGGQFAPALQTGIQSMQLAGGTNPYDFYRNRGILPKDVQEAGTLVEKMYSYMVWSLANDAPGLFSYRNDIQSSTETLSPYDYLAKQPIAGPLLKRFLGVSNYGDFEKSVENKAAKDTLDSDIRLNLGPNAKSLYNEFIKASSFVSRHGKGWETEVSPEERARIHTLYNWHARAYRHAFNELRSSFEKGDEEDIEQTRNNLELSSKGVLKAVQR